MGVDVAAVDVEHSLDSSNVKNDALLDLGFGRLCLGVSIIFYFYLRLSEALLSTFFAAPFFEATNPRMTH